MNFFQILSQAISIYASKSVSFKVKNQWLVSVSESDGNPVHLDLSQAVAVLYLVLSANTAGTFKSGNITVVVTPLVPTV